VKVFAGVRLAIRFPARALGVSAFDPAGTALAPVRPDQPDLQPLRRLAVAERNARRPGCSAMTHRPALLVLLAALGGCPAAPDGEPGDGAGDAGPTGADAGDGICPPDGDGLACLFALHDEVAAGCDPTALATLEVSLALRAGALPAWHDGRALFVSRDAPVAVAGAWNGWDPAALHTEAVCGSTLHTAVAAVPSGRHPYKVVRGGAWSLDPESWAFAYDDFAGNPDGRNSVLNSHDSGVGHLVAPPDALCAEELGCRGMLAYLPPGYDAPASAARRYPVVFMHDGQNVFDDRDCCFGHTGWEVNVALDAGIAGGALAPVVIVAVDSSAQRIAEYGGHLVERFMAFQVEVAQPAAAARWRLDPARTYVAGSSLGGLLSFRLAWAYPAIYAGAASLSGAFWFGKAEGRGMRDVVAAGGMRPVALYLDHGGTVAGGGDDIESNLELVDLLAATGFSRADSPACAAAPGALCYHHEVGGSHDELAWRDRAWRFLTYFAPAR
jgi:hypothetical protein